MGDRPRYRVVELADPREPDLPRAVFACRCDQSPWLSVWQRDTVPGRLSVWLRELSASSGLRPLERTLLGRAGVHEKCARAVARFRLDQIARAAGTWPEYPSFIMQDPPVNVGKKGVPVWADGVLYPSRAAAARAVGVTPRAVRDRIRYGRFNWL